MEEYTEDELKTFIPLEKYDERLLKIITTPGQVQKTNLTTHKVIGQEFDNVLMILNSFFEYDGNRLKSREHPNPDYIFVQLLYQGLTRTRNKLKLIVTKKELLNKILTLFQ